MLALAFGRPLPAGIAGLRTLGFDGGPPGSKSACDVLGGGGGGAQNAGFGFKVQGLGSRAGGFFCILVYDNCKDQQTGIYDADAGVYCIPSQEHTGNNMYPKAPPIVLSAAGEVKVRVEGSGGVAYLIYIHSHIYLVNNSMYFFCYTIKAEGLGIKLVFTFEGLGNSVWASVFRSGRAD